MSLREKPGTVVCEEIAKLVRVTARTWCHWSRQCFPGAQPVALMKSNVCEILRKPYLACEKTDGVRYLLFVQAGKVYLIDRSEEVLEVPVRLVDSNGDKLAETLLDGELVEDLDAKNPKALERGNKELPRLRYLVFDAIRVCGVDLTRANFLLRLQKVVDEVILPKRKKMFGVLSASEPLQLYMKDFFEVWYLREIMDLKTKLPHLSDGVIFTPIANCYQGGTCYHLIKWKPREQTTVDFRLFPCSRAGKIIAIELHIGRQGINLFTGWYAGSYGKAVKYGNVTGILM
eukprot:GHVL01035398.1.p1 GENE.GHVL01035398.1~~GHVL01035398.1.p1  ORF type:complete len:288 (+),score=34.12 GHVL01035398.1:119-982(+)